MVEDGHVSTLTHGKWIDNMCSRRVCRARSAREHHSLEAYTLRLAAVTMFALMLGPTMLTEEAGQSSTGRASAGHQEFDLNCSFRHGAMVVGKLSEPRVIIRQAR
jgi:hypothetical protein